MCGRATGDSRWPSPWCRLHNLVDFSLFVSGVALPWAVLLGWAVASGRPEVRSESVAFPQGSDRAGHGCRDGIGCHHPPCIECGCRGGCCRYSSPVEQFDGAMQALKMAPWRVEPQFLLATSAIVSNDQRLLEKAWHELDGLRWLRPSSSALARRRARLALGRGDVSAALTEFWIATVNGVPGGESESAFGELLKDLERAVNDAGD